MSNLNNRFRIGSVFALIAQILSTNPGMSYHKAKTMAGLTKRVRVNKYNKPHYGNQAAARNRRHAADGTHGLHMSVDGSIVFG